MASMSTRGRIRKDQPYDYARNENQDYNEMRDERSMNSSGGEEPNSEIASKRAHQQFDNSLEDPQASLRNRGAMNRRGQKAARPRSNRGRSVKVQDSLEFKEVVDGFIAFIEELNNMKKRRPRKPGKKGDVPEKETKDAINGAQAIKKVKHNPDYMPQSMNGNEQMGMNGNRSNLYTYKDDATKNREMMEMISREEVLAAQGRGQYQLQHGKGGNAWDMNQLKGQMQQGMGRVADNKSRGINPLGQMNAGRGNYNSLAEANDTVGMKQLLEMFMTNSPNAFMNLAANNQNDLPPEMSMMLSAIARQNKMQIEEIPDNRMQRNPEGQSSFKPLMKRASTHVALAYYIYTKTTEKNNANPEVNNQDPTFNARKLKEQSNYGQPETASAQNSAADVQKQAQQQQQMKAASTPTNSARKAQYIEIDVDDEEEKAPQSNQAQNAANIGVKSPGQTGAVESQTIQQKPAENQMEIEKEGTKREEPQAKAEENASQAQVLSESINIKDEVHDLTSHKDQKIEEESVKIDPVPKSEQMVEEKAPSLQPVPSDVKMDVEHPQVQHQQNEAVPTNEVIHDQIEEEKPPAPQIKEPETQKTESPKEKIPPLQVNENVMQEEPKQPEQPIEHKISQEQPQVLPDNNVVTEQIQEQTPAFTLGEELPQEPVKDQETNKSEPVIKAPDQA